MLIRRELILLSACLLCTGCMLPVPQCFHPCPPIYCAPAPATCTPLVHHHPAHVPNCATQGWPVTQQYAEVGNGFSAGVWRNQACECGEMTGFVGPGCAVPHAPSCAAAFDISQTHGVDCDCQSSEAFPPSVPPMMTPPPIPERGQSPAAEEPKVRTYDDDPSTQVPKGDQPQSSDGTLTFDGAVQQTGYSEPQRSVAAQDNTSVQSTDTDSRMLKGHRIKLRRLQ